MYALRILVLCFQGAAVCMNESVSASVRVSLAFALALFLFVLSYLDLFVFYLCYFIIIPWVPGFVF